MRHRRAELGTVIFEVGGRCNLSCSYCYNAWKGGGGSEPAAVDHRQAMRTLRRLFRDAKLEHLGFSGGEPLLAERLPELVLHCRLRGVAVSVISNGKAGTAADLRRLITLGVAHFVLPLHADSAAPHDAMTGRPGSWDRSLASIRTVREAGGSVVASMILSRLNADRVPQTLRLVKALGLRRAMLNRFNLGGRGLAEAGRLQPSAAQLAEAFEMAHRLAGELDLGISSNIATPYCLLDPARFPRLSFARCSPDPRRRPLALEPDGTLRFCNHSPMPLGNIFRTRLADILRSSRVEEWSRVPEDCRGCAAFIACQGGCRAAAEQAGSGLASPDPVLDRLGLATVVQSSRS